MINQLEYTSCEDGLDGITGFQVRAASAQLPATAAKTAIQDSVYTPSPGLPPRPEPEELAGFPVAFGYSCDPEPVLYRSVYAGTDHSGRWGNYFMHALVLDGARELGGALPIDFAESPVWRARSERVGELPTLPELVPAAGPAAVEETAAFLSEAGRAQLLAATLAAVRASLTDRERRLVVVVDSSRDALLWISAVTRSLPRRLALGVTFTSFTARPQDHRALLAFTTPDVTVPRYGSYQVLDLTSPQAPAGESGDYDGVVAQLWQAGSLEWFLLAADRVDPPLQPGELDAWARLAALLDEFGNGLDWEERGILDALDFGRRRVPAALFQPWDVLAQRVRAVGGPTEVDRWGETLEWAVRHQAPVPGPLLRRHVLAALDAVVQGAAASTPWLPELDDEQERMLAQQIADRLNMGGPAVAALQLLEQPQHARVRGLVVESLGRLLADMPLPGAVRTVTLLPAPLVAEAAAHAPGVRLAVDVAAAAAGRLDRVDVLRRADPRLMTDPATLHDLVWQLWQDEPPTTAEGLRLTSVLPPDVLADAGLFEGLVARLAEDAQRAALDEGDFRLAEALVPQVGLVDETSRHVIDAVRLHRYFSTTNATRQVAERAAQAALRLPGGAPPGVAEPALRAMTRWALRSPYWDDHVKTLLELVLPDEAVNRLYLAEAGDVLATAEPEPVARLVVAWYALHYEGGGAARLSQELLHHVLPAAVGGRGKRTLDRIAAHLEEQNVNAVPDPPAQAFDGWAEWWDQWRVAHEKTGLLGRFRGGRRPGRGGA